MRPQPIRACILALAGLAAHAAADEHIAADERGAPGALDEVMHSLAARRHGAADFVELEFVSLLKHPVESSGTLRYDAPDRLEKRTVAPRAEILKFDAGVLTIERNHRSRVLDLQAYPQIVPFVEGIRSTLAGDRAALEKIFRLEFSGSQARWTLTLTPRDQEIAKAVSEVRIDGADQDLQRVEIERPGGDHSLMTLRPATP